MHPPSYVPSRSPCRPLVRCVLALIAAASSVAGCDLSPTGPSRSERRDAELSEREALVADKRAKQLAALRPDDLALVDQSGPGGQRRLVNREALIPPQCYTRTEQRHNPCYVCHQEPNETEGHENRLRDGDLQGDYDFSEFALENHWKNLFKDRSREVAAISDEEILRYVASDNYQSLRTRMQADEGFDGWKPDLDQLGLAAGAFDAQGFAKDGSGWVAFNYMPMPSTFWPTNGSTDDVMIRLPGKFRRVSATGVESREVYLANLFILEAAIKNLGSVDSSPLDEKSLGVDLDGDGKLGRATRVVRPKRYLGAAADEDVTPFLYPAGTEFLHTVRYVGTDEKGAISVPRRMKEVRYMVKRTFVPKHTLAGRYDNEFQEKEEGNPPYFSDFRDKGIDNGFGWLLQGYLEDTQGELRPNQYEETLFCMGCHSTIGTTVDHVFAFGRKVEGPRGFGYVDLRAMKDTPALGGTEGEILTYLRRVGGGSEFRSNEEMQARWFTASGAVDEAKVRAVKDVYTLITPSRERALLLNKAYRVIVKEQSFLHGRDATVTPPVNVFAQIPREVLPLLPEHRYTWDIRLAWSPRSAPVLLAAQAQNAIR